MRATLLCTGCETGPVAISGDSYCLKHGPFRGSCPGCAGLEFSTRQAIDIQEIAHRYRKALEEILPVLDEFREPYPLMREDAKLDQVEDVISHALEGKAA